MSKQPTSEERIDGALNDELIRLRWLFDYVPNAREDGADARRECVDALGLDDALADSTDALQEALCDARSEHGLYFDYVPAGTFDGQEAGYFRYQLFTGGPSAEFRFFTDAMRHCHRVEYVFLDWFDGARRELTGDDKTLLLRVWEGFGQYGNIESALRRASEG